MSLSSDIAPHLPFLRRYARAITGSQWKGDNLVRVTLETIADNPEKFPQEVDPRLGLFWLLHQVGLSPDATPDLTGLASPELTAHARLVEVPPPQRQALLLTAMEGFSAADAGYVMDKTESEVEELVAGALAEVERQTRADVLIIEDEPIIAMDIETIVRDLGHRVTGVASTRADAVSRASDFPPDLVLADIQLADDSSGIDAVRDILRQRKVPVIIITAFPERLLTGERLEPTFLITKPFQRSTVKAAIAQALFFDDTTILQDLPVPPSPRVQITPDDTTDLSLSDAERLDLRARPGPINAEVVGDQLRLATTSPTSVTPQEHLDAVRKLHLTTAKRLSSDLSGSNVGPSFNARLDSVRRSLNKQLSDESALHLAIQSRGLQNMKALIEERLDEATAVDVLTFVDDVTEFAVQFSAYRSFMQEARSFEEITHDDERLLTDISQAIEGQPDHVVEPELKHAIAEARSNMEEGTDPIIAFALLRSIANVFRAIGRYLGQRGSGLGRNASQNFDKVGGAILGGGIAVLVVGGALNWILTILAGRFPQEFGFVLELVKWVRELLV